MELDFCDEESVFDDVALKKGGINSLKITFWFQSRHMSVLMRSLNEKHVGRTRLVQAELGGLEQLEALIKRGIFAYFEETGFMGPMP